jgi:hypothetical protein
MWSSPPLIGPGGVSDKLAWGAGLGLRVMYVDVGGTATSVDGWRAGATLIAQAELPNGWGSRQTTPSRWACTTRSGRS